MHLRQKACVLIALLVALSCWTLVSVAPAEAEANGVHCADSRANQTATEGVHAGDT